VAVHSAIHAPKPSKRTIRPAEERASHERRVFGLSQSSAANKPRWFGAISDVSGNHAKSSHPQTPRHVLSETRNLASPVTADAAANLLCRTRGKF
jgi:hypothetical protein